MKLLVLDHFSFSYLLEDAKGKFIWKVNHKDDNCMKFEK